MLRFYYNPHRQGVVFSQKSSELLVRDSVAHYLSPLFNHMHAIGKKKQWSFNAVEGMESKVINSYPPWLTDMTVGQEQFDRIKNNRSFDGARGVPWIELDDYQDWFGFISLVLDANKDRRNKGRETNFENFSATYPGSLEEHYAQAVKFMADNDYWHLAMHKV